MNNFLKGVILKKHFLNLVVVVMLCIPSGAFAMDGEPMEEEFFENTNSLPYHRRKSAQEILDIMYTGDGFNTLTNEEIKEAFCYLKCEVTTDAEDRPGASSHFVSIFYPSFQGGVQQFSYMEQGDKDPPLSCLTPFFQEVLHAIGVRPAPSPDISHFSKTFSHLILD
jgi:hypothetical protein